jgi:hypothetical protein
MNLTPIETEYAGIRFRSRLEARWAVFFDALGIVWEYEPDAFRCCDGTNYLPDFRLADAPASLAILAGAYAEVKPPTGDFKKSIRFSHSAVGNKILLCSGPPKDDRTFFLACGVSAVDLQDGKPIVKTDMMPLHFADARAALDAVRRHRFWNPVPRAS